MIINANQLYELSLLLTLKHNLFRIGYSDIPRLCCVVKNRSTNCIGDLLNKLSSTLASHREYPFIYFQLVYVPARF